jgi:hypothetical protein
MSLSRIHRPLRRLHLSTPAHDRIGPPHPISNIRPVIYDDTVHPPQSSTHPYSLQEFQHARRTHDPLVDYELRWKLHKQQLDTFNHAFWTDVRTHTSFLPVQLHFYYFSLQSNSRFDTGKNVALSALPDTATDLDKEHALTAFYQQWLQQEHATMDAYTDEWRRRNLQEIVLAARVHYYRLLSRLRPS